MNNESTVQFETNSRIHVALAVKNIEKSITFYKTLFGQEPTKIRPGYAKFEVADPPVNLALNQVANNTGPNNPVAHFGVQLKSTAAVHEAANRIQRSGFITEVEASTTCCYSVQTKVWTVDPDGNKWEVYVVLDDNPEQRESSRNSCCPGLPAIMEAVQDEDMAVAKKAFDQAGELIKTISMR